MASLRYAALGIRRSVLVRPAAIISPPAQTLVAGRHSFLLQQQQHQQHHQSFRLSSTDSSPSESPSDSPSSSSTSQRPSAFVPQTSGPPPYDIPVLEPPWQVSNLSLAEQKAYAKYGANYLDHLTPKRREGAIRSAYRRQYIAELYSKDVGPDWYEIYEEAAKKSVQSQAGQEAARTLKQMRDLDIALQRSIDVIWKDLALTHQERLDKIQIIQRQRKDISDKRIKTMADKRLAGKKIVGEVLAARGRTLPDWCFTTEDVPEKNNEQ